ncbi:MFS transporter [Streptomyces sp. NPDC059639]|uniref:MFS transporter n=1 Tax=Streptomyces sp. NPDC059639 TaxID=3346891 RepID=UPI0036841103
MANSVPPQNPHDPHDAGSPAGPNASRLAQSAKESGGAGAPRPPHRPWRTAVLGGMASYMDAATIVGTGTALVLYKDRLGLTPWTIGALSSILTLGMAVGAILGGRLGDTLGRRRVFTYDLVVYIVGLALLVAAVNPWMLFTGVALAGLSMGADIPTSLALVAEEAPADKRGRLVAFSQVLWSCGGFAAYLIAYLVSDAGSLGARIIYGHVAVVALVVLVLRSRLRESREWLDERERQRSAAAERVREDSWRTLLHRPLLVALLGLGLFYAIGNLVANTFGQFQAYLFTEVAGSTVSTATLVGMCAYPLAFVAVWVFMRYVEGPGRKVLFTVGILLMACGIGANLVFSVSTTTLILLKLCITIGSGLAGEVIFKVWAQEFFPTLIRGTAQGIAIAFTRFAAAGFALVTPAIAAVSPAALMSVLLAAVLLSGLLAWLWIFPLQHARARTTLTPATIPYAETSR